jgi:uncharacterized repeat protein (TIGR01451 family)
MPSRRIVFLTLSVAGLVPVVLLLAVLAQAQDPAPLPAVPDVAIAPPAGRSTAPPGGALSEPRFSPASQAGPVAQKPVARSLPSLVQPASGPYRSPGTGPAESFVDVGHHDSNWNRRLVEGTAQYVWFRANAFGDWVDGSTSPEATVWITATDNLGVLKGTNTTTARPDGWFDGVDLWLDGQRTDLLPGDVIYVASSDGTTASGTLIAIEGELSVEGDSVSGQMSGGVFPASGHVDLWQRSSGQWFGWDLTIEADGSFNLDLSDQVDVQAGDYAEVWYYDEDGNWLGTLFITPYLQANVQRTHNWVNGEASPFVTVMVIINDSTGAYKGGGESWTGGGTWFHVDPQCPDGSGTDIVTGDTVIVSTPGISGTLPVIGLEATVDAASNVISGHIPDAVAYPADLDVEVWDRPTGFGVRFQTDENGDFSVDLTGSYDVRTGEQLALWYVRPDGHRVGIVRSELRLYPNVTDDSVGEATEPQTFVEITVTDSGNLHALKGTASGWSDAEGLFGLEPSLNGERTDILPGDLVEAIADGRSASLAIPDPFSAVYDYVANTMSGQAPASSTLQVWIDNYAGFWITVPESGEWSVDYTPYGDPQIWDEGHVNYYSEEGHVARLECRIPVPDLRVEKWVEGNNQAAPGGPSVFTLRYGNDGTADATTIILTDTLPADTSYITDTSGVTPDIGPGWVMWTLPGLAPGEESQFQLVLVNSASPGATLLNQADVWAEDDYNTGNNHAEAEVYVIDEQPDLYVNKSPSPGDPAPGQTFLWEIYYGNGRPVPAGPVVLTDTFPAGTSFVAWYSENGYDLWQEVETGDRLVLSAPAIPGYWGDRIILQLQVDPDLPFGTQLLNRIEVNAPNDANPDDNWQETNAWVSPPRRDAGIYKSFSWGQLVPGGEAAYSVHFRNHGNMAAAVTITDTLPTGTHFAEAWAWVGPDYVPFPPAYVDDEVAVWEVGTLEPGVWINLDLILAIDEGTPPGTDLTNCIAIVMEGDNYPSNDTSCATDTVREPGPNLRLHKSVGWNGYGQLEYEIRLENIGSEALSGFEVTDLYPEDTAWNGDWWVKWGPWMTATHDAPNRQLVFWVESLDPGGTAGIGFRVDLDGGIVGEQGLAFTNVAEAPIAGDVYPADNEAVATARSGPDLFTEKWVSDGQARSGEVLTFTVRTGNANRSPWEMSDGTNLILVERLPDGMSLVTAVWPDGSPVEPFFYDPASGLAIFNFGRLGSEDWRWFYLAVRLGADLWGEVLLNRLEVWEWPAVDIDPVPDNDEFEYAVRVEGSRIFLPTALKNW